MVSSSADGSILARGFRWSDVVFSGKRVSDFTELRYGKSLVESARRPGPFPVFGTNGSCGRHDEYLEKGPGVILGRKGQGHLGVEWCESPFWVIDTAYYAKLDTTQVDPRWFYYITKYVGLDHLKSGEKPGLNRDVFGRQVFPCPRVDEQRVIARILGTLDDKIELNREINRTLEATAQAIFRSWFVDFDPVVAKADGRKPFGMTDDLAVLFPARFAESELGPVPEGWKVGSVSHVAGLASGKRPQERAPKPTETHLVPVYGGAGPMGYIQESLYSRPVIITGRVGTLGQVHRAVMPCWPSDNTLVLEPRPPWFEFVYFMLHEFDLPSLNRGSTQPLLAQSDLGEIGFCLPPGEIAFEFSTLCRPLLALVDTNELQTQTLAYLRDLLLPKLLSGEIRVADAEAAVEESGA